MTDTIEHKPVVELGIQERAELVPASYFNFISSQSPVKNIEPALIFTRSDLVRIKRYTHQVHRLPTDEIVLARQKGFSEVGIDAEGILHFYKNLKRHADTWEKLENYTKDLGSHIELFSEDFAASGNELITTLESTEAYQALQSLTPELARQRIQRHSSLSLQDRRVVEVDVPTYLKELKLVIKVLSGRVTVVTEMCDHFSKQIGSVLVPTVELLLKRVTDVDILARINTWREEVATLDLEIEKKDQEYSAFVGYSFTGLVFGPLGLLVTGGIYGAKAEDVRRQRSAMVAQRAEFNRKLGSICPLVGELEAQGTTLKDLKFLLTNVEAAAKNLEDVWRMLDAYIDHSESSLAALRTDVAVAKFIWDFKKVLRPWQKIGSLSRELSKIFNEPINDEVVI
ncbi:alpha-xenorhabdolysin family binary toxin subunit A [Pseudomonas sp. SDI]|uniref:alpha-xenorhabdolysin family binary toxin subunit A n=1 Tax=Pseudomonas sp. SDI TaxID=2170734 RepID=UPI0010579193|nr:alpha-xenorhabdolysin family binary toxin subunit A [Pseudomonas sp. SDI]